jgi:hypothetical protein
MFCSVGIHATRGDQCENNLFWHGLQIRASDQYKWHGLQIRASDQYKWYGLQIHTSHQYEWYGLQIRASDQYKWHGYKSAPAINVNGTQCKSVSDDILGILPLSDSM